MASLRTFAETMSRKRVLVRHLPKDLDLAREFVHQGDTVWDIGANVGLFTIPAAQRAGPHGSVVAIEPDIWLASLLQRTATAQPSTFASINILPVAVSGSVGIETFHIAKRGRASNHLSSIAEHSQAGSTRETFKVLCITLDWLLEHTSPSAS